MRRRGPYTHRVQCAENECREVALFEYERRSDYQQTAKSAQGWRCIRHSRAEEMLSPANPRREMVLTVGRFDGLDNLYFLEKRNGFMSGPGFRALAEDFPEGTRIRVKAEIVGEPCDPLAALAAEFVRYWTTDRTPDGCGMCGGTVHSSTCYVGRMDSLLRQSGSVSVSASAELVGDRAGAPAQKPSVTPSPEQET